jgi:hypothetical protein
VLDHETYIFNIETANVLGPDHRPSYFKYYTARKDLEMESLFPADYDKLARRMASDDTFYSKYFRSDILICFYFSLLLIHKNMFLVTMVNYNA